ncbi:unnamed protein product [Aphanomyces euteiches]
MSTNPYCKKFRYNSFPLFEQLSALLDGSYADGRFSSMPPGVEADEFERDVESQPLFSPNVVSTIEDNDESDESSDESTPPPKKKCQQLRKRDKRSAGAVIGDAISKLVEVEASKVKNNSDPHERVTLAIDCLMENYSHLDGMNIANLADMMSEGLNATIFMALRGPARDAWIAKKCT